MKFTLAIVLVCLVFGSVSADKMKKDAPFITSSSLFSPVGEFVWQQDDYDLTLDFKCNPDNADQLYLKFTQTYTKGETAPINLFAVAGVTPELTLCSYDSANPGVSEGGADVSASSKEVDGKVVNTVVCLWNFTLPVPKTEFSISFSNGKEVVTKSPPSCLASFFQVPTPQCGVANIVVKPAVFVSPSGVFDWAVPLVDGSEAKYNMDVTCGDNQFKVVFNQDTEKNLGDAALSFLSVKGIKDFDGVDFCRFGNDTDTGIPFTVERTTSQNEGLYRTTITCLWPINFPTDPIEFFIELSNEPAQTNSPPSGLSKQPPACVASHFQTPNQNCVVV
eukprot:Nk52_evm36s485 gene=Nk52_evmTU36s485